MPAPTTVDEFLQVVRKSGVLEAASLDAYVQQRRDGPGLPDQAPELANAMLRDGILTRFQAQQFLQGKWKGFIISGKYKLLEHLGTGGMGMVYLCEHVSMRRRVAIKVLPMSKAQDSSALDRFYREARAVAALDHPNIVRAHDIDHDQKLHFLVMEYVEGSSFQEIVKKHGPMDFTRAAHYISQAAGGLQSAHEAGLVHRDIKPGNLLLDRCGTVKILDLGLARFFHDAADELSKKYDENVIGTADYLAPEQTLGSNVDIRADIYSLGATFYFLLTGSTPFSDGTTAMKLIWHQTRVPKPVRSLRPDVPDELALVVQKMMAKEEQDRYQTPIEVVDALAPWTEAPIGPPPAKEMPRLSAAAMGNSQADGGSSQAVATAPRTPTTGPSSPRRMRPPTQGPRRPPASPRPSPAGAMNGITTTPMPPLAQAPAVTGDSTATKQAAAPPDGDHEREPSARKARVSRRVWWWVGAGSTLACILFALFVWWLVHGLEEKLAGKQGGTETAGAGVKKPVVPNKAQPVSVPRPPAPAPAAPHGDVAINVDDNHVHHVTALHYEADVEADGCLTSLRVGGVEFLRPGLNISRGTYFLQDKVDAALSLPEIDQPSANVLTARGQKASIHYEFGSESLVWTATNLTDKDISFFMVFSRAVTAVANDQGEFAKTPVTKSWPATTWFAGGSKLEITGATGIWPWVENAQVCQVILPPHEPRKIVVKVGVPSDRETAKVAAVTGSRPAAGRRPGGQVAIKQQDSERRIKTPKYEAVVEADGCLTHLRAGGTELLLVGQGTLSRGTYMFDLKDPAGPVAKLSTIEQPDDHAIVAKGDKLSIRYEFDADSLNWTLTNGRKQDVHFFIVFDPAVTVVMSEQGELAKTVVTKNWPTTTWFAGKTKLKVTGGTSIWGPWEGKYQVWDCVLGKGETRNVALEVGAPSPAEAARVARFAPPPKPAVQPDLAVASPSNYQVFQRQSHLRGKIAVRGRVKPACNRVEARLRGTSLAGKLPGEWQDLPLKAVSRSFNAELPADAGGWYVLEVRAFDGKKLVARAKVDKVGVGEVLITAGQSNAANYGGTREKPEDDRVAAWNGDGWQLAADPQPLAQGSGGTPWPLLGDLLVKELQVPIGLVSVAVGGTSVKQWQPDGLNYPKLQKALKYLGPNGARCVLWHQGESDTVAGTSAADYAEGLLNVIKQSRSDAGYDIKWFVAGVAYFLPENHAKESPVREGQKRVCDGKLTFAGPTTDDLVADFRWDRIHFSDKGLKEHARRWADVLMKTVFKEEKAK